jgi:hypothetical protein
MFRDLRHKETHRTEIAIGSTGFPKILLRAPFAMAVVQYPVGQTGKTSERLTWPSAKLLSIEAMLSSRVSLSLMNRS